MLIYIVVKYIYIYVYIDTHNIKHGDHISTISLRHTYTISFICNISPYIHTGWGPSSESCSDGEHNYDMTMLCMIRKHHWGAPSCMIEMVPIRENSFMIYLLNMIKL